MEQEKAVETEKQILIREVSRLIQGATTQQIRVIYRFVVRYLAPGQTE